MPTNETPYVKVWYRSSELHSLPAFITGASNVILRSALGSSDFAITTYSHPISARRGSVLTEADILNKIADFGVAMVLVVAFSLIPATLATLAVEERASKQRHLQRLTGIGRHLYWTSAFLWDYAIYGMAVVVVVLIMIGFGQEAYTSEWNLYATISLLLLYGMSNLVTMYHLQRFFVDSTMAFVGLLSVCLFIVINTMVCVALLTMMSVEGVRFLTSVCGDVEDHDWPFRSRVMLARKRSLRSWYSLSTLWVADWWS